MSRGFSMLRAMAHRTPTVHLHCTTLHWLEKRTSIGPACGQRGIDGGPARTPYTHDAAMVTCKKCLALMAKLRP